jgi:hypothetical protein
MGPGARVMGTGWYTTLGLFPERLPYSWAATPEVKLNIAPNVSAMVASTIANDVFMFDSFKVSAQTILSVRKFYIRTRTRAVAFATRYAVAFATRYNDKG